MRCWSGVLAVLAVVLVTGCGQGGAEPEPAAPVLTLEPAEPASPAQSGPAPSTQAEWDQTFGDLRAQERAAVDDLAERLSVDYVTIVPAPLQRVTWPDSALGCPERGGAYTQALVDGSRLILTQEGQQYAYHAGPDGDLKYCAQPSEPATVKDVS